MLPPRSSKTLLLLDPFAEEEGPGPQKRENAAFGCEKHVWGAKVAFWEKYCFLATFDARGANIAGGNGFLMNLDGVFHENTLWSRK